MVVLCLTEALSPQRCPLGSTVLKVKLLDMGEPRALLATALSPPRLGDIGRTVLLLKEVGRLVLVGVGSGTFEMDLKSCVLWFSLRGVAVLAQPLLRKAGAATVTPLPHAGLTRALLCCQSCVAFPTLPRRVQRLRWDSINIT